MLMKFAGSEARSHGRSAGSHEVGRSYFLFHGGSAVGTERQLSAGCEVARAGGSGGEKESAGGKARAGGRRQEAFQTKLRGMSWRLGAGSEDSSRSAASGRPGSERWHAVLENHERKSGSWYAVVQRNPGTATMADCASLAHTQAQRQREREAGALKSRHWSLASRGDPTYPETKRGRKGDLENYFPPCSCSSLASVSSCYFRFLLLSAKSASSRSTTTTPAPVKTHMKPS